MNKKLLALLTMAVLTVSSFTLQAKDTKLVVAQNSDAKSLNPQISNDIPTHRVNINIYDRLIEKDKDMNLIPGLAESWEQADPLTLILKIRKGVKFHNGDPLTVGDVVFSLKKATEAPALMAYFGDLDKIEAVDENTVKITTKVPYGPLVNYLAHVGAGIMSEKAVTAGGSDYGQHPVGTGPFIFESWTSGDRIVLKANPDYYKGKPGVDSLTFRVIPEGTNRTIALETGEADIAYDIDPIDMDMVKNNPKLKADQNSAMSMTYLGFNTQRAPFDKKEVRQAIAYATDADSIINAVFLKAAKKANSPVSPNVFGYNKDAKLYTQNIAKAKELLAEAGYPNGFKARIWTNDKSVRKDTAVILQDQLKQIGIDVQIEILEWGSYLDRVAKGEHDMFILGWSSSADSDSAMYALFHSKNLGGAGNRTFYKNAKVDELLDKARESTVPEDRIKYYKELQDIIQEDLPMFALVYPDEITGMQKNIEGFVFHPEGTHYLAPITKK
ncbi:glutathione ABC transporter substrate-binding protein [uncultured Fusobacterium sp.]|uniref:glutathione ABC transporter substrate-binding protein n=1 Tax=uncultured Fusobacterium sp. TaxID=159267 RepID=UPI0027DC2DEC|nr:glutathione ABC transporter substrate-binding protein [uncultured Fusobacterium sp.]